MMQLIKEIKRSTAGKNLICFPHSGAFSSAFRPISQFINPDWGVVAIDPPGHGPNRAPLVEDIQQMVDLYMEALQPRFDMPFVLFGHSLGGLVVYLLTQRLEKQGIRPEAVIISGTKPPHLPRKKVGHYAEEAFLEYVINLGGISPELAQHQELLDLFMPVIRADFRSIEDFEHVDHTPLQTSTYVFSGSEDHAATQEECQGWTQWATHVEFHTFHGEHMFIMTEAKAVSSRIQTILNRSRVF